MKKKSDWVLGILLFLRSAALIGGWFVYAGCIISWVNAWFDNQDVSIRNALLGVAGMLTIYTYLVVSNLSDDFKGESQKVERLEEELKTLKSEIKKLKSEVKALK